MDNNKMNLLQDDILSINYAKRHLRPPTDRFVVVGAIYGHNACCNDKPYLVCVNKRPADGSLNYSCECYCGLFCTNGHSNLIDAIAEYEGLSDRRQQEQT